jgi:hypothetical protein
MKLVVLKKGTRTLLDTNIETNYMETCTRLDGTAFESVTEEVVAEEVEVTTYTCDECEKTYKTEAGIKKHIKTHNS